MFSSGRDEWETPQEFFDELNKEFHFTLDPCATDQTAKCKHYYTKEQDGLSKDWSGETVFCNPPYSKKTKQNPGQEVWIKKCWKESQNPETTVVLLIPARTDTKAFHKYIYKKAEIRFLPGRLRFVADGVKKGPAPFPSMVVVFRRRDESINKTDKEGSDR